MSVEAAPSGGEERVRARARRRFLSFYPGGFDDPDYVDLERAYKARAHGRFSEALGKEALQAKLDDGRYREIADEASRIEGRTHLLFSFEKMALRDGVRTSAGAKRFARGLDDVLYGGGRFDERFERWCEALAGLPRRQTRVLTWPVATVFLFLADPKRHLYMKPQTTRQAAQRWGFPLDYRARPNHTTYASLLAFGRDVRAGLASSSSFPGRPARDQIDVQSFIWVLGSTEYD